MSEEETKPRAVWRKIVLLLMCALLLGVGVGYLFSIGKGFLGGTISAAVGAGLVQVPRACFEPISVDPEYVTARAGIAAAGLTCFVLSVAIVMLSRA